MNKTNVLILGVSLVWVACNRGEPRVEDSRPSSEQRATTNQLQAGTASTTPQLGINYGTRPPSVEPRQVGQTRPVGAPGQSDENTTTAPSVPAGPENLRIDSGVEATRPISDRELIDLVRSMLTQSYPSGSSTPSAASLQNLQVSASNGVVTLRGTVQREEQSRIIESSVRRLAGVKDVKNDLRVGPGGQSAAGNNQQ